MEADIHKTVQELDFNQKCKITFQGKKFILKKTQNNQIKISPKFPVLIEIINLIISFFIVSLLLAIIFTPLVLGAKTAGKITHLPENILTILWIVELITKIFLAIQFSKLLDYWLMKIMYKSEYLKLKDTLNNT